MLSIDSTKSLQTFTNEAMAKSHKDGEWNRWCHYWMTRGFDDARTELVETNLRFAYHLAAKFQGQGVLLEDLVSAAAKAMVTATHKWEPSRGMGFTGLASYFIKNECRNQIRWFGSAVTLPVSRFNQREARDCIKQLRDELGRDPTDDEFVERSGMIKSYMGITLVAMNHTVQMDSTENIEEGMDSMKDRHIDEDAITDEDTGDSSDRELLDKLMGELTEKERYVVCQYFGIDSDGPRILEDIGQEVGLTRERVRQIKKEALDIMKRAFDRDERFAVRARRAVA